MYPPNQSIPDPAITELGHEQCVKLKDTFGRHGNIDLVTASPLHRTIQTALESFEPVFKERPDLSLIVLPCLQENSNMPCDTGSDLKVLQEKVCGRNVDLSLVLQGWNEKASKPSGIRRMSNQLTPL